MNHKDARYAITQNEYTAICLKKWESRWKRKIGIPLYRFGFGTLLTEIHEGIEFRQRISKDIEGFKDSVWYAYHSTRKQPDFQKKLNEGTLYWLSLLINNDVKRFLNNKNNNQ